MARKVEFSLYLITDRKRYRDDRSFLKAVDDALSAGVRALQLREKDLPTRRLLDMAAALRDLTAARGAKLFINDRADIARCVGADGVHLARSSMPVAAVRRVVGEAALIGASTHDIPEAVSAEADGADFITFGRPALRPPVALMARFARFLRHAAQTARSARGRNHHDD